MIVVDTSVFIDSIFEYDLKRTAMADNVFKIIHEKSLLLIEPDIFKVELIGQLVRRMSKKDSTKTLDDLFPKINFIPCENYFDIAYKVALEYGSRAVDAYYIAVALARNAIIISNDKHQIKSAKMVNIESYYLLDNSDAVIERLLHLKYVNNI